MRYGIDVSDCNGLIDWKKVKASGVEFAILRTTRGSGMPDNYLPTNIKGCKEQMIPFDFYKYSYALTEGAARVEAKNVIKALQKYGIMPSRETRIWLDLEYDKQLKLGVKKVMSIMYAFRDEVQKAGYGYGLYMGKYAYEHNIDAYALSDDVWLARYPDTSSRGLKSVPAEMYRPNTRGDSKLYAWQFSAKGKVDGIKGDVDLDVCYVEIKEKEVELEYYKKPEFTLIDSLNKIGVVSTYNNRRKIAEKNGIKNYEGTAEQNLRLLELLNNGKLIK